MFPIYTQGFPYKDFLQSPDHGPCLLKRSNGQDRGVHQEIALPPRRTTTGKNIAFTNLLFQQGESHVPL